MTNRPMRARIHGNTTNAADDRRILGIKSAPAPTRDGIVSQRGSVEYRSSWAKGETMPNTITHRVGRRSPDAPGMRGHRSRDPETGRLRKVNDTQFVRNNPSVRGRAPDLLGLAIVADHPVGAMRVLFDGMSVH